MTHKTELPDLDRLEALARAATPGPWYGFFDGVRLAPEVFGQANTSRYVCGVMGTLGRNEPEHTNAKFIAAANPAAVLAVIALARRAQPEGEAPQAVRAPATGDKPHGYWHSGEWYGYDPDENAINFAVGSTVELTPVWTHNQAATFNVVGSEDSDDVSLVPASPADAALCNWTETPAPAATLSPLCGAQQAESGAPVELPSNEELESVWENHVGHPADFAADVLQRWGGWQPGLLGYGGKLAAALAAQSQGAPTGLGDRALLAEVLAERDRSVRVEVAATGLNAQPDPLMERVRAALAAQQAAAPGALDERALRDMFERDALTHLGIDHAISRTSFTRDDDGGYQYAKTRRLFALWQAARGQAVPSAPGAPEAPAEDHHPLQPLVEDARGTVRFKANAIVVHLTRDKLNDLACMDFSVEDREQLAQLIGYSLGGFAELSYVTDETYDRAAAQPVVPCAAQLDGGQGGKPQAPANPHPYAMSRDCFVSDRGYQVYLSQLEARSAPQTAAARDVLAERQRQIDVEGRTSDHDDQYAQGQMAQAAACYAAQGHLHFPENWPWSLTWWKPAGARRNLVKAGALILADIERLDRAAAPKGGV